MIVGIGTDIVEIARIEAALQRHGERFPRRVLGAAEIARFEARRARSESRGVAFLATRFAAKEAYSKAIGLGMRMPMTWRSMQLLNEPSGKPIAVAGGALDLFMRERGWHAEVSVSDEHAFAVAFVVVSDSMPIHRSV